jgi:hypothetical protein
MAQPRKKKTKKKKPAGRKTAKKSPTRRSPKKSRPPARKAKQTKAEEAKRILIERLGGEYELQEFLEREGELALQRQFARQALESDGIFLLETEKVKKGLEEAYGIERPSVESFLQQFPIPGQHNFHAARTFINTLPDKIRKALVAYVRYSSRFGVYLVRRNGGFDWNVWSASVAVAPEGAPPWRAGRKFLAWQRNGHLVPAVEVPHGDGAVNYFESPRLSVWPEAQELIYDGKVKFVVVVDTGGYSVLNELERMAYYPDGVTVLLHHAERPYLLFLFGEKVQQDTLHETGKILTAFRKAYGRGAGKPLGIPALKKAFLLNAQGGRVKDMATQLNPNANNKIASDQAQMSRIRRKLR